MTNYCKTELHVEIFGMTPKVIFLPLINFPTIYNTSVPL